MSTDKKTSNKETGRPSPQMLIFLCWLAYTAAYLGRYSYNSNITAVIHTFGVSHADVGLVTTCFFFAYGAGQIINGIFCKRYSKKWIIPFALGCSALMNIAVFFGAPFWALKYLWLVNGAMQSILWPTLIYILSQSLPPNDLGKSVIVMSTTVPIGTLLAYGLSSFLAISGNFLFSFLTGAVVMGVTGIVWFFLYREAPYQEYSEKAEDQLPATKKGLDPSLVFTIVILCLFAVANNLVKDGLTTWVPSILKEKFGLQDSLSILLTLTLPLLGMFGAACNTALERKLPSFISLSGIWYLLTALCMGIVMLFISSSQWWMLLIAFGLISLFMHAVNNAITSMAPLYMRERINSGLLAGILNGCCYIGSTVSSYGLGAVADRFGWNGVFLFLTAVSCVPVVIAAVERMAHQKEVLH